MIYGYIYIHLFNGYNPLWESCPSPKNWMYNPYFDRELYWQNTTLYTKVVTASRREPLGCQEGASKFPSLTDTEQGQYICDWRSKFHWIYHRGRLPTGVVSTPYKYQNKLHIKAKKNHSDYRPSFWLFHWLRLHWHISIFVINISRLLSGDATTPDSALVLSQGRK